MLRMLLVMSFFYYFFLFSTFFGWLAKVFLLMDIITLCKYSMFYLLCFVFFYWLLFFCLFLHFQKTASALSPAAFELREESPGSRESPYFLTGRDACRKACATDSATENIPPSGKGENAR